MKTSLFTVKVFDDFGSFSLHTTQASNMIDAQYAIAERLECDPDMVWVLTPEEARSQSGSITSHSEPVLDNPGFRPCNCEDYPCCGH